MMLKRSIEVLSRGTGTHEVLSVDFPLTPTRHALSWAEIRGSLVAYLPGYLSIRDRESYRKPDGIEILHIESPEDDLVRAVVLVYWRDGEDPS